MSATSRRARSVGRGAIVHSLFPVFLLFGACGDAEPETAEPEITSVPEKPRNVLFICVDTLREDHTSGGGYARKTSPNLDTLSARGTRFSHCFSTYPQTAASIASIFTSLYPTAHKVRPEAMLLSSEPALLAETFRAAGYQTAAIASNPHLTPGLGFERGFEYFCYVHGKNIAKSSYGEGETLDGVEVVFKQSESTFYGRADAINEAALEWIDTKDDRPYFLYLHYMDVHSPYKSPANFNRRFIVNRGKNIFRNGIPKKTIGPHDLEFTMALYDGGISFADNMIAQMWNQLQRRGLLENTYIVFVSDHGDEFLEHGGMGHGKTLYREQLNVPFFVVGPDVLPQTIDATVSTLDIFPTLCDLVGLDQPAGTQGRNLAAVLREGSDSGAGLIGRAVLSECDETRIVGDEEKKSSVQFSLTDDEWRLIHCTEREVSELFRYRTDPREESNLAAQEPERVARMIAEAERLREIAAVLGASIESGTAELDEETMHELDGLGYGGGE